MGNAQGLFVNGKDGYGQVAEKTDLMARTIEKLALGQFGSLDRAGLPYFKVARTTGFILNNLTDHAINWQTRIADPDQMWGPGTPRLIRVNTPGLWLLCGQVRYPLAPSGSRAASILTGGLNPINFAKGSNKVPAEATGEGSTLQPATIYPLGVGEELYLNTWHSSPNDGASNTVAMGFGGTWFAGVWLGPTYGVM